MKVSEKTIKETLTILKLTYPNSFKDLSKEEALLMINLWKKDFENDDEEIFKQAIARLRQRSKYLPSIAEIKNEIATLSVVDLQLNAESEWELVLQAVRRWGTLDNVGFEKITMDTIKAIGQRRLELIETANIPFMKREFIEIWNSKRDGIEKVYTQNVLTNKEVIQKQLLEEDRHLLLDMGE